MTRSAVLADSLVIPAGVGELAVFRRWACSPSFPDSGRIDYLQGAIELDMSPEELQSHGLLKSELHAYVHGVVKQLDLGQVFVDRARLSSQPAGLSCEPDVLLVSWEALEAGRVRYLPPTPDSKRLLEVEGAATLVVEVISDSSVAKDKKRLPPLYARAGVEELWLADARSKLEFRIFHLEQGEYRAALADAQGYQTSRVLGRAVRLRRQPGKLSGTWRFWVDDR